MRFPGRDTIDPAVTRRPGSELQRADPANEPAAHAVDMGDAVIARIGHDIPEVETPPPSQTGVILIAAAVATALALVGLAILFSLETA